jgi:hypothetical protein
LDSFSAWNGVDLQSEESKCLKRLLQAAVVEEGRRIDGTATIVVVVLHREDEGREPEVGEYPSQRGEVALVEFHKGQDEGGEVQEGVDGALELSESVMLKSI